MGVIYFKERFYGTHHFYKLTKKKKKAKSGQAFKFSESFLKFSAIDFASKDNTDEIGNKKFKKIWV